MRQGAKDWPQARAILQAKYDLEIEEDEDCFSVSYKLQSKLWGGSPEERLVLSQSRGTIFAKPIGDVDSDYSCVCLPFLKFW